jgi:hypothetical protein
VLFRKLIHPAPVSADTRLMAYDVDRRPGTWVSEQAGRKSARVWLLAALLVALALVAIGLVVSSRATALSSVVAIALALGLRWYASREVDTAINWLGGARAEEAVGDELNALRHEGFVVMHDIDPGHGGNVDHLVSGPTGVFMVETKLNGFPPAALLRAKRHAAKIHDEVGVWVTPVICIHRRKGKPFEMQGVWIVPRRCVLDWVRAQRNKPVAFERLERYADGL